MMSAKKIVLKDRMELYNIVAQVNRHGLEAVAAQLDCDKSTLSRWLRKEGYTVKNVWELTPAGVKAVRTQDNYRSTHAGALLPDAD